MSNASALFRSLVVYALCLPLAVVLGYFLADPLQLTTFAVVGIVLLMVMIPLFLRWHHAWLIATWNTSALIFFLPGKPAVRLAMIAVSFAIAVLQYTINRRMKFLHVPSVTRSLLLLTAVVLITMRLTGGIGLKAFGSDTYGGKNYIFLLAAVVGYFALTSRQIPRKRAPLYVALFFFGGATLAIGDLPAVLPQAFKPLFLVFPLTSSGAHALQGTASMGPSRWTGLGFFGVGFFSMMLAHYGLRGVFLERGKIWRAVAFGAVCFVGMMGGFRSVLILCAMTFVVLFYLEGLHRTRMLPVLVLLVLLGGTLMAAFANRLPFSVQRAMAFLPLNIDPVARASAATTTEWRLQIWRQVLPEVPQYLILGKGYGFSGKQMGMIQMGMNRQTSDVGSEGTALAMDYHNGPLSVLIPFGLFGLLAFLWFLWAGLRVTYQNYCFGDPAYRNANTFIFAFFVVKCVFFFTIFGALNSDIILFTGLVGLSISLNGGVAKPVVVPEVKPVFNRFKLHPSVRRPVSA